LTIDAAHSSLSGIRDAVNAAKCRRERDDRERRHGNRPRGHEQGHRRRQQRCASTFRRRRQQHDTAGLSKLAYDPTARSPAAAKNMTQLVAAQDATLLIDGLPITRHQHDQPTRSQGVTLQLTKTKRQLATTLTVFARHECGHQRRELLRQRVQRPRQDAHGPRQVRRGSQKAGPLQGERHAAHDRDRASIRHDVTGPSPDRTFTRAAHRRPELDRNGKLTLDTKKAASSAGATLPPVQKPIHCGGDARTRSSATSARATRTQPGNYDLSVTQLATQAPSHRSSAAALLLDSSNDQISLSIDGVSTSVALTQEPMRARMRSRRLQSKVNGAAVLTPPGPRSRLRRRLACYCSLRTGYGASSVTAIQGGIGAANLFQRTPTATPAWTVGDARRLRGQRRGSTTHRATAAGHADGLQVKVQGVRSGHAPGPLQHGWRAQLDAVLTQLESTKSAITARTVACPTGQRHRYATQCDGILRLVAGRERSKKQFGALDLLLTQMQQTTARWLATSQPPRPQYTLTHNRSIQSNHYAAQADNKTAVHTTVEAAVRISWCRCCSTGLALKGAT